MAENRMWLNVGGKRFATSHSTLQNVRGTRLARLSPDDDDFDPASGEYFFDRNPVFFQSILDFYRTGQLHFPHCLCGPSIQKELQFWKIEENCISPCCWKSYKQAEEESNTMKELSKSILLRTDQRQSKFCPDPEADFPRDGCLSKWQRKVWSVLEVPYSSVGAKIWAALIFLMILTSILVVALETHPTFRVPTDSGDWEPSDNSTSHKRIMFLTTELHPALNYLDSICTIVFFVELTLRFLCSPSKVGFFKSGFNIVDIFCVLPMLVVRVIEWFKPGIWSESEFFLMISYLSLASVLRVFRLFKVARHYRGLKILQLAVISSLKELFLLIIMIVIGMLIFSTLIYYAEFNQDNKFTSIPISFWWSVITMTTVGYGDISPGSGWGYLVGGMCAVSGTLITGLPIPIIASNFNHYYNYSRLLLKIAERKTAQMSVWQGRLPPADSSNSFYTYSSVVNLQQPETLASTPPVRAPASSSPRLSTSTARSCCRAPGCPATNNNKAVERPALPGMTLPHDMEELEMGVLTAGDVYCTCLTDRDSAVGSSFNATILTPALRSARGKSSLQRAVFSFSGPQGDNSPQVHCDGQLHGGNPGLPTD